MLPDVSGDAEVWIPLVDEPIGSIVAQVQQDHAEIGKLVSSPQELLAFRTFAYIRVGILLGRLFVEHDVEPAAGVTWAEQIAAEHHDQVVAEVLAVAREASGNTGESLGPSADERARFSEFAKRRLAADT
jgi:hypothetical protein